MNTAPRGNASEAAVVGALTAAGIDVLIPFGGGLAFDLAGVMPDDRIVRVQVKTGRLRNGCDYSFEAWVASNEAPVVA